ncbi:hypothetical protein BCR34DRAFT_622453 [Clohesyomyces aquaticus]|uniref:Uncharacterized protein n=1 Tax=Clohesyomyces aquaticus TaxID=1231657 RepID=A0A1Y2A163_9PLEO|nr:hypothetical protein BCR34DRAFT_622453 [Clohesyomyces aquaticus]
MTPDAPPPYRHLTSMPLSLSTASSLLSTYLLNSETHPHLHPDALIAPAGVTFSSNGGPMGGVIMHNLRRVAAGLHGEFLEPERTPEPEEEGEGEDARGFTDGMDGQTRGKKKKKNAIVEGAVQEDWQDMSEFERQVDGAEGGEIAPEDTFVAAGGDVPEIHVDEGAKKRKKEGGKQDKDAKKKAKKERQKAMRREKEMKRAKNED